MLTQFLYALPVFLLSLYGILHLAELGYLVGATEQASFYAARSRFVGQDRSAAVARLSDTALYPAGRPPGAAGRAAMTVRDRTSGGVTSEIVSLPYPALLPRAGVVFGRGGDACGTATLPEQAPEAPARGPAGRSAGCPAISGATPVPLRRAP